MKRSKGLVIKLREDRIGLLDERIAGNHEFSEPVPWYEHGRGMPLICFVIVHNQISHIALGSPGKRAGTRLKRINLNNILKLWHPVPVRDLLNATSGEMERKLASCLAKGGILDEASLQHVVSLILKSNPDARSLLAQFLESFQEKVEQLSEAMRTNLALQKEALLTALLISGHKMELQKWEPSNRPRCFLDGIKTQRCGERQIILNDFCKFPGFKAVEGHIMGTATFESPTERLIVIYADNLPLEELTGADLIYYNDTYKSFIFIQYKMLDDNGYRPDEQLDCEISRIEQLMEGCVPGKPKSWRDFRLHGNPFFLKFCNRLIFNPQDISLSQGMYIPLEYWKTLESTGALDGSRGGKLFTANNAGRHLSNTEFAVLVAKGWVGSAAGQSDYLEKVIEQTIGAGRTAVYAIKEKKGKV